MYVDFFDYVVFEDMKQVVVVLVILVYNVVIVDVWLLCKFMLMVFSVIEKSELQQKVEKCQCIQDCKVLEELLDLVC